MCDLAAFLCDYHYLSEFPLWQKKSHNWYYYEVEKLLKRATKLGDKKAEKLLKYLQDRFERAPWFKEDGYIQKGIAVGVANTHTMLVNEEYKKRKAIDLANHNEEAIAWFEEHTTMDADSYADYWFTLGEYYFGLEEKKNRGIELIEKAARVRNTKAIEWQKRNIDKILPHYKVAMWKHDVEAIAWFQRQARAGNMDLQFTLGEYYCDTEGEWGNGFKLIEELCLKEYIPAVEWITEQAEDGYARAQLILGAFYGGFESKHAKPRNFNLAMKWLEKAADQGDAHSQNLLGSLYYGVEGFPKDHVSYEKAAIWYGKAAEQGHARAQFDLAEMYESGKGVPMNLAEARELFDKAAKQGILRNTETYGELSKKFDKAIRAPKKN